jgi:hypothetical protein
MSDTARDDTTGTDPDLSDLALNDVGVLRRRAIEARILVPVLDALAREFGQEGVRSIARDGIVQIAHAQGAALAGAMGGCSLGHLAASLGNWTRDDALQIRVLDESDHTLSFDVTRCRYAEMYRSLGVPELGALLSCNRDASLIGGFNPDVELTRTQTLMQGASHCDFRYQLRRANSGET